MIRHQEIGTTFEGVYYVESLFVKKTVQDKDYTDMMLRDRSGARAVKYWGVVKDVAKGDYVYVSASVGEYMGNPSIVAKNVEKEGVPQDMSDYIPVYDDSDDCAARFDVLRARLAELEAETGDKTPGMMVDEVYKNAAFFEKFVAAPGSARPHYGRQGGLLAGTVRTAEACLGMADSYGLDSKEKGVMLGAALLLRIGAIDAYEFRNCMPATTKRGMMLGMANLTMTRVSSALKRVVAALSKEGKAPDQDTVIRILHAVASHDARCVAPMTKEAMVLSSAYRNDSEMVDAMDFIANDQNPSEEFTAYDPSTGRRYYVGVRGA